jgi:hypothetical protein
MVGVDLGLAGKTVFAVGFGDSVCLYFSDGHVLGLETTFAVGTDEVTFDVADAEDAATLFAVVDAAIGAVVSGASADEGGGLCVCFSDGFVVSAEPDAKSEAWRLAGPNGVEVVCRPSGGLTVSSRGAFTRTVQTASAAPSGATRIKSPRAR